MCVPVQSKLCTAVLLVLLMCTGTTQAVDVCLQGMFKYTPKVGPDICLECNPGSFMPHHLHTERMCYDCTKIKNPDLEILVSPCNRFQDTQIQCIDGYFRTKPSYPETTGHCQKCTRCPFAKGGCHDTEDTLCCRGYNYAVRINKEGRPECVRQCGPGQFLDVDQDQCLPCPANTFMHEERHTHIYCWNCNVLRSDHEVLIQPCTSTDPGLLGCTEGYYQRSTLTYLFQGCAKCQVCSENTSGHIYEARGCDNKRDTVCCDGPDMIVVDTPEGPVCQHQATDVSTTAEKASLQLYQLRLRACGKGEYLSIGPEGTTAACLPCSAGTCMHETDHFNTSCRPCVDNRQPSSSEEKMTSGFEMTTMWDRRYFITLTVCGIVSVVIL